MVVFLHIIAKADCYISLYTYIAKDPDITQTVVDDSTATSRVCVNLGAADEEDSDDVMHDSDNGQCTFLL